MNGKLIVIEGLDGSGKATQAQKLYQTLLDEGIAVKKISFPNYDEPSSALVKMYLGGELGDNVDDVNAYAASSFYSVDRFASYQRHWKQHYCSGGVVLADRYTTSNMVYQMEKLPKEEWDSFLSWLEDFEYTKLGLPKPDSVLYLDMHPNTSKKLLLRRYGGDEGKKDLHERNFDYLLRCRQAALYAAKRQGWIVISCCNGEEPYPVEKIAAKVRRALGESKIETVTDGI